MKTKILFTGALILTLACLSVAAQDNRPQNQTPMSLAEFKTIQLERPDTGSGDALMAAMKDRKTDRDFTAGELSLKHLSEILWAAYGVNREDGKRTVPSALALYPNQLYVILSNGIYLYEAEKHQLVPVVEGDHRELAGGFPAAKAAPVNLVFIADYGRYANTGNEMIDGYLKSPEIRVRFASLDAGHSTQNVYLYCAAQGIKACVRGAAEPQLKEVLGLDDDHEIIVAQTIGY
ncbi:MAG: SagB/ThcOx family dehydrogenase [Alistipes sp.]|nr:SagB/ThcOx family dehydrogenase [Alistipes sp.]